MAGNKVTIKLTEEQQQQIKAATGHSIKELNINITEAGELSDEALDHVAGGAILSHDDSEANSEKI
jgi:hypothetical protein